MVDLRNDPFLGFRFLVEIEGLIVAGFTEVTGLSAEVVTTPYREGGLNSFEHQLPGPTSYPHLVLKRGLTDSGELWSWQEEARYGHIVRHNGSIILRDAWRWDFYGAYPVKWTGPDLRADSAAVAIESVELVHQGLTMGPP